MGDCHVGFSSYCKLVAMNNSILAKGTRQHRIHVPRQPTSLKVLNQRVHIYERKGFKKVQEVGYLTNCLELL